MANDVVILLLPNKASGVAGFRYVVIVIRPAQTDLVYTFSSFHKMIEQFGHSIEDWAEIENALRASKAWKGRITGAR